MSAILEVYPPIGQWHAEAILPASKSLSNRWLILEALSGGALQVEGHSDAEDTIRLQKIIRERPAIVDAGAGGTTFRFALAYLCAMEGYSGELRGSARLHERPVKPLVDALKALGADIEYLEKTGFPPLGVKGKRLPGGEVKLDAEISSQFLTALLLIVPALNGPLLIQTGNKITSRPYLDMTLELLRKTGTSVEENDGLIRAEHKGWQAGRYLVEKDWSSASYWYALAALSGESEIFLPGLSLHSLQGDALTAKIFSFFGLNSIETEGGIRLVHSGIFCDQFGFDFVSQPDLAQTLAAVVAGLRKKAWFGGLESLRRKETDRIQALRTELAKINVITSEPHEGELLIDASRASFDREIVIDTYDDHRMALAFAPLSLLQFRLMIRDHEVVKKSYPGYWTELRKAGFTLRQEES
jgi:3-phosphoshikimate 1-carboxyvinyltransferase